MDNDIACATFLITSEHPDYQKCKDGKVDGIMLLYKGNLMDEVHKDQDLIRDLMDAVDKNSDEFYGVILKNRLENQNGVELPIFNNSNEYLLPEYEYLAHDYERYDLIDAR